MCRGHMDQPVKIAIINTHPITYFAPLYRHINNHPKIDITVIYLSSMGINDAFDTGFNQSIPSDFDLLNGYEYIFCGSNYMNKIPKGFFSIITPEIWKTIRQSDCDVVWFHGYNYAAYIIAFVAAICSEKKIFFRSETHFKLKRTWLKRTIRDSVLRIYFGFVDGFLAIGSLNKSYYEKLGVPTSKITLVPYTVDNERFASCSVDASSKKIGLSNYKSLDPSLPTVLYCAKFIPRKYPDLVLQALNILHQNGKPANLIMAGNGPELRRMQMLANQLNLSNVFFAGFVGQTKLPELYALCDIFVHPSDNEPWGLVINEVMAAGLPIIVGKNVGSAEDLVIDDVNGSKLEDLTAECLAKHISEIIFNGKKLKKMSKASRTIIKHWDFDKCLDGIIESLKRSGFKVS